MNPKKKRKTLVMSVISKSLLLALAFNTANAVSYTDSDFPFASGITVSGSGQSTINTTGALSGLQTEISTNTTGGTALSVSSGADLTIDTANPLTINVDSNSINGIRIVASKLKTEEDSDLIINLNSESYLQNPGPNQYATTPTAIYLANSATAEFNGKVEINMNGSYASNIPNNGKSAFLGIQAYSTSTSATSGVFNKEVTIKDKSSAIDSYGIGIVNGNPGGKGPTLTFNDKVNIFLKGEGAIGLYAEGYSVSPSTKGEMSFNEGLYIDMEKGDGSGQLGTAISSTLDHSLISIQKNADIKGNIQVLGGELNINAVTNIKGTIESVYGDFTTGHYGAVGNGDAIINLTLQNGSRIEGAMNNYHNTYHLIPGLGPTPKAGEIHVNFNGGSSTWNMSGTGASYINTISGNGGTLEFKSNVVTGITDTLTVTDPNGASGTHKVSVANDASQATNGTETLALIYTQAGTANFIAQNQIELGGYLYEVRKSSGTDTWELYSVGAKGGNGGAGGAITSTANAAANALNAGYLISYVDTQTILQRVGQLRENQDGIANVWARGFAGKLDSFGGGKLSGYSMDYYAIQAGADKEFAVESGRVFLGLTAGYTRGKSDLNSWVGSSSTVKSTHLGIYGTYVNESKGFYVDGLLKNVHMKHDLSVLDSIGQKVGGSGSTNGYSFSIEAGKHFEISDTAFYIEPQVQLTYSHQNSTTIRASNGLNVKLDSYDSLLGRLGVIWGYKVDDGTNKTNIYLKTSYLHEFKDQSAFALNNSWEKDNLGGHWFDVGLGVSATISKQHNLYGDLNYSKGSHFDRKQINIGYRYEF